MIMVDGEILGTTKIADKWRISFLKEVREVLSEQGYDIEEGDRVVYRLEDGQIIIEPNWCL